MISFHKNEVKNRIKHSFLVWLLMFLVIWHYKLEILTSIISLDLIFTSLGEALTAYIKLCFILSFILSFPVFLFHYCIFIIPGLYKFQYKKKLYKLIIYSITLIIFSYLSLNYIFNLLIEFFVEFQSETLVLSLKIIDFISFLQDFLVSFLFLFVFVISNINLKSKRKFLYLFLIIVIALLTPPDLLSLLITSIPIIIILELKYLLNLITGHRTAA